MMRMMRAGQGDKHCAAPTQHQNDAGDAGYCSQASKLPTSSLKMMRVMWAGQTSTVLPQNDAGDAAQIQPQDDAGDVGWPGLPRSSRKIRSPDDAGDAGWPEKCCPTNSLKMMRVMRVMRAGQGEQAAQIEPQDDVGDTVWPG